MAAGDGGDEEPPDLPDDLFADGEAQEKENDGLVISKPVEEDGCQPQRTFRNPGVPTQAEIDEHEARGHATYRSRCEACIQGHGTGGPHLRSKSKESNVPIVAFDYLFVAPGGDQIIILSFLRFIISKQITGNVRRFLGTAAPCCQNLAKIVL